MKIIICGDAHLGAIFGLGKSTNSGLNSRVEDYEKSLNYIVDYAINNKADVFVQTGDVFDSRTPALEHMNVLNRAVKKLSMANITSVIIMGNHDYRRNGNGFTSAISSLAAKDYPNVKIILEPEVLNFYGPTGNSNILLMPYRDRRMYSGKTVEEDSKLYEEEMNLLLEDCEGTPTIAIGHNFFYAGNYQDYSSTEILVNVENFKKCDLLVMGHYHQFKILKKKDPIAFYIGSMEKLNFGDENVDKFFIDYDTNTKKVNVIKNPVRKLLDLKIDLSESGIEDCVELFLAEIKKQDLLDKIVRVKIIAKDTVCSMMKKNELEKILYDHGVFYVSKIIPEPIVSRIIRDESILNHKDDFSMFQAFVKGQSNINEEELSTILVEISKIIGE